MSKQNLSGAESGPIIQMRGIIKRFGSFVALKNVDLEVTPGEVLMIIGPSGSGKSTLLRCINLLERPSEGYVVVDGVDLMLGDVRINEVRREVGMVFQRFELFPHLTVEENITLAPRIVRGMNAAEARTIAHSLLEKVGIPDKADRFPAQLSGGQQQRVAIARALAMQPKVMLFDEPTSALDPEMIKEVLDVMQDLAREGMTMVIVSHEMGFARNAAHRVIFMDAGEVVEMGQPDAVFSNPQHERTQLFLSKILH